MLRRGILHTARRTCPRIGDGTWSCSRVPDGCSRPRHGSRRLMTLAVETSCDDTSVAIVEKGVHDGNTVARLHFHKKVTSNNTEFQGVHPLLTLKSHQENLATLIADAIAHLPHHDGARRLPDFVSVTRGPGMRSNLFTGLDTAKGLAVAWQVPLVGVHHMQAHALTPRLVAALDAYNACPEEVFAGKPLTDVPNGKPLTDVPNGKPLADDLHGKPLTNVFHGKPLADGVGALSPAFPILSVLASGGHTILITSTSLTDHTILGTTDDVAVGECLDKAARVILPPELLQNAKSTMYGALLETFAFPSHAPSHAPASTDLALTAQTYLSHHSTHAWYTPPPNIQAALERSKTKWGWSITPPLTKTAGGTKTNSPNMTFSGLMSAVERLVRYSTDPATGKPSTHPRTAAIPLDERRAMALGVMRAAFEHVASRVVLALRASSTANEPPAVVMAGGVASNGFLRHVLASTLCARGYGDVRLFFPPPAYCTDNAAMIGWTGVEMYEKGFVDGLGVRAIRKWPLDELLVPVVDGQM